jgi:hypothetical protein
MCMYWILHTIFFVHSIVLEPKILRYSPDYKILSQTPQGNLPSTINTTMSPPPGVVMTMTCAATNCLRCVPILVPIVVLSPPPSLILYPAAAIAAAPAPTTSQRSSSNFLAGKKDSSTKISMCRKQLTSYQIILSKLNAITRLTTTSKWSIALMEIFLSLDKYLTLCRPKSLGPS